ncbi:hypothetical protein PQI51_03270 [Microbacterium esteraromaticum]|uniref:hypothetical protein n=1 Tax=Microbacterium esteraromaticum TaxID=57043 RepID=UPI0030A66F98
MSDYTPTTEQVRTEWALSNPGGSPTTIMHAEAAFDRWLAAHDAEKRAEWEAEHPDVAALREARAETWDEAVGAVFAWWNAPEGERPAVIVNPYGVGVPVNENGETPPTLKRRLRSCVEQWPGCETGAYNPACCRFPKSCSATVYDESRATDADLEPATDRENGSRDV